MNEDDYLWISNIQHYVFSPRKWAPIKIDGEWKENILMVTSSILHEKVHQINRDKRSKSITVRGIRVKSDEYKIQGQCDAKEYIPKVKKKPGCKSCSLYERCQPQMFQLEEVSTYMKWRLRG